MKKKIVIALIALVILAGGIFTVTNTRLFKASPNIVIILTDDMDNGLLHYMEQTSQLIGTQGATFSNYFIPTPLCCPSRTSTLRGQYSHNTDILENTPGFARFFKLGEEENALPVWLSNAGYKTALFGKYLNNYPVNAGKNYIPPGWTDWAAFLSTKDESDFYYNYTINENGTLVNYGNAPADYSTDVIRARSLAFINQRAEDHTPFFLFVSVYAPHGPATPAPRHLNLYNDLTYPQGPSFNEADLSDKPQVIRSLSETGDEFDEGDANNTFRSRVRSVQAVDELVADLVTTLEQNGQLKNTYIFFMSDNGFHLGEHKIPSGKGTPYEEDIRVPLMVRGPGIEPGRQVTQMSANIDIAPTIADIIGIHAPNFVDGRSLVPCLTGQALNERQALLVEFGYRFENSMSGAQNISFGDLKDPETDNLLADVNGGNFRGIRAQDFVYVEYQSGEIEFYDLKADPYQMKNLAGTLNQETLEALHINLEALMACSGGECRALEENFNIEIK